jgi:hypothetical protein
MIESSVVRRRQGGFSLVELAILLVLVLVIVVVAAVNRETLFGSPRSPGDGDGAHSPDFIQQAIARYAEESRESGREPLYPLQLDDAPVGTQASADSPLFTNVVPDGITSEWRKVGANQYIRTSDLPAEPRDFSTTWFYDAQSGSFEPGASSSVSIT